MQQQERSEMKLGKYREFFRTKAYGGRKGLFCGFEVHKDNIAHSNVNEFKRRVCTELSNWIIFGNNNFK